MEKRGVFYVRFMYNVVVLARTRWQLRRAVKALNSVLGGANAAGGCQAGPGFRCAASRLPRIRHRPA